MYIPNIGEILVWYQTDKTEYFSLFLHKIICCGYLFESTRREWEKSGVSIKMKKVIFFNITSQNIHVIDIHWNHLTGVILIYVGDMNNIHIRFYVVLTVTMETHCYNLVNCESFNDDYRAKTFT